MAHIVFRGLHIDYIIDEINVETPQEFNTSPYIGTEGSTTNFINRSARTITFKSLCKSDEESRHGRGHRINDYIAASKNSNKIPRVLTSPSNSNIDGNYICTKMDYTEDTKGNYIIEWEFQEVLKFNVTEKTFRVWGKAVSSANKSKKTTTKKSTAPSVNSNEKYLLGTCGTMKKGSSSKKCVKALQKFLQSKGYYKGYKIDGIYAIYTEKAVKALQKKFKLKTTGQWDKATRTYWQKKYKYPKITVIDKGTIGNKNAVYSSNKRVKI